MGAIPRSNIAERQYPRLDFPQQGNGLAQGLSDFSRAVDIIAEQGDKSEVARKQREIQAGIGLALKQSQFDSGGDPDVFESSAKQNVNDVVEKGIAGANGRVQNTLRQVLNDDLTTAQKHIDITGHAIRKDKALGDHLAFLDESAKARAMAQSPGEAAKIDTEVEARTNSLVRGGLLTNVDGTKELQNYHRQAITNYGDGLINAGNFDKYFEEANRGTFSTLSQADQLSLDNRVDIKIRRQTQTSKDLKKAQVDDAIDNVAGRIEQGENPKAVWNDLSGQLKAKGLFGLEARQRFDQLVTAFSSKKGEDSEEYNAILDGFEKDRARFPTGIPDRGTVAKWMKAVDGTDIGIEAQRKIRLELINWNTRRAQFEQAEANRDDTSKRRQVGDDIKKGENLLRSTIMIPPKDSDHPTWDEMQAQKNYAKAYQESQSAALAEGDRTGNYFDAFKKRADQINASKIQQKEKASSIQSLSPQAKDAMDTLNKLKGAK